MYTESYPHWGRCYTLSHTLIEVGAIDWVTHTNTCMRAMHNGGFCPLHISLLYTITEHSMLKHYSADTNKVLLYLYSNGFPGNPITTITATILLHIRAILFSRIQVLAHSLSPFWHWHQCHLSLNCFHPLNSSVLHLLLGWDWCPASPVCHFPHAPPQKKNAAWFTCQHNHQGKDSWPRVGSRTCQSAVSSLRTVHGCLHRCWLGRPAL